MLALLVQLLYAALELSMAFVQVTRLLPLQRQRGHERVDFVEEFRHAPLGLDQQPFAFADLLVAVLAKLLMLALVGLVALQAGLAKMFKVCLHMLL
ncbi:hypothetical protein D3C84_1100470 [compost metagenome]